MPSFNIFALADFEQQPVRGKSKSLTISTEKISEVWAK